MAKILYVYNDQVYANITNKCDCNCTFCIRKQFDGVGDADTLWHKAEPSLSEIIAAIDAFDFTGYKEFVFCGYGEPTCALENLIASARYVKEKTGLPIRVNSNGLGNLYYKRDIVPQLAEVVDSISISLNEATAEKYEKVTRPSFPHAYEAMLDFAEECGKLIPHTQLQVVLVKPEKFEDASGIADHLLAKRTVVLNLESTNREIARRLVDFLSGVAYANGGQIKKVANSTYIITPYNVGVMGDSLLDELENSGLYL